MGSFEKTCRDLECGGGRHSSAVTVTDNDEESTCFWEAEEGSCSSQVTADSSNHDHNIDSEIDQVLDSRRVSSVVGSDCIVDIDNGVHEVQIFMGTTEIDCRICQLSLDLESEDTMELGCSCKNELAAAHQHCAETWFTIKGNNICEICNSIAQNIIFVDDIESSQQISEVNTVSTNAVSEPVSEVNTVSTNAVSAPVSEVSTFSRNVASVPVSSTSESWASFICDCFFKLLLSSIFLFFILLGTREGLH